MGRSPAPPFGGAQRFSPSACWRCLTTQRPAGFTDDFVALIEAEVSAAWLFRSDTPVGTLLEGDLELEDADIEVIRIGRRDSGATLRFVSSGADPIDVAFEAGGNYAGSRITLQTADAVITFNDPDAVQSQSHATRLDLTVDAADQAGFSAIATGTRFILAISRLIPPVVVDVDATAAARGGIPTAVAKAGRVDINRSAAVVARAIGARALATAQAQSVVVINRDASAVARTVPARSVAAASRQPFTNRDAQAVARAPGAQALASLLAESVTTLAEAVARSPGAVARAFAEAQAVGQPTVALAPALVPDPLDPFDSAVLKTTADLLITQWRNQPRMRAVTEIWLEVVQEELLDPLNKLREYMSLDRAEGVWLELLGVRLGVKRPWTTRASTAPIFGFDQSGDGFDQGLMYDPDTVQPRAPIADALYRVLLYARVVTLTTPGTFPSMEAAIVLVDPNARVVDNNDMSFNVHTGRRADIELAARAKCLPIPAGVQMIIVDRGAFGFDQAGVGFDQGHMES